MNQSDQNKLVSFILDRLTEASHEHHDSDLAQISRLTQGQLIDVLRSVVTACLLGTREGELRTDEIQIILRYVASCFENHEEFNSDWEVDYPFHGASKTVSWVRTSLPSSVLEIVAPDWEAPELAPNEPTVGQLVSVKTASQNFTGEVLAVGENEIILLQPDS